MACWPNNCPSRGLCPPDFNLHPPPPLPPINLPPPQFPPPAYAPQFPQFCVPPPSNFPPSVSHPPPNVTKNEEHKLKDFIKNIEELCIKKSEKAENTKPKSSIKVSDIKTKMVKSLKLLRKLEGLNNCLIITQKSLSNDAWIARRQEVEEAKVEFQKSMTEFENAETVKEMANILMKRRKKRHRRKEKLKEWQEWKKESKLWSEQEKRRIDLWLENMKDRVERNRREEDIKREADLVLSDVTIKKAEAKKMLNLLNTLAKLRAARLQNLTSSGVKISQEANSAFKQVIEGLRKMWIDQLNGYKLEEEGLRLMLNHAEEERASIEVTRLKKSLKSWSDAIFGTRGGQEKKLLPQSVHELVQIRNEWDNFIQTEHTPMASHIPVGWILPCEPSSQQWAAYSK